MEKKSSRQILYVPGKSVSQTLKEKANVEPKNIKTKSEPIIGDLKPQITKPTLTIKERSEKLYKWLELHPLINLNGLCKKTGADRANFIKSTTKTSELKEDLLLKFIKELKIYGYAE